MRFKGCWIFNPIIGYPSAYTAHTHSLLYWNSAVTRYTLTHGLTSLTYETQPLYNTAYTVPLTMWLSIIIFASAHRKRLPSSSAFNHHHWPPIIFPAEFTYHTYHRSMHGWSPHAKEILKKINSLSLRARTSLHINSLALGRTNTHNTKQLRSDYW